MKNKAAIEKWGSYVVTLKRADELEVGDKILEIFDDLYYTFPYRVTKKRVVKAPRWEVTVAFHTECGEGESVDFEKTFTTSHIFPVVLV